MTRQEYYDIKLSENYRIQNYMCFDLNYVFKICLEKRQRRYTKIGSCM